MSAAGGAAAAFAALMGRRQSAAGGSGTGGQGGTGAAGVWEALQQRLAGPQSRYAGEAAGCGAPEVKSRDVLARVARGRAAKASAAAGGGTYALPSRTRHVQNMDSVGTRGGPRGRGDGSYQAEMSPKEEATLI